MRLADLEPWIKEWQLPEMYAGVPGVGAEEAWWTTAIDFEDLQCRGLHFTGGAVDIYKCFDQVVRSLVYAVARAAGMPARILTAYAAYHENLHIHNSISGGLGQAYARRNGIVQGCPCSMMLIALIMRGWLMQMAEAGIQGRILADDILVWAKSTLHLQKFAEGLKSTHTYFTDMGAKVAAKKSLIFSTDKPSRKWLEGHRWGRARETIKVVKKFRDLGGARQFVQPWLLKHPNWQNEGSHR